MLLGLFGTALLFGDGMITPAISVLSAVEGIELVSPGLDSAVVPISVAILVALFAIQRFGTGTVGRLFGPVMVVWFAVMAVLGAVSLARTPEILQAVNPVNAVRYFTTNTTKGFLSMGSLFLVVTGGEALYADMGHFGRRPIRVGWYTVVMPSLLLTYLGIGGLLLREPEAIESPFFLLAPDALAAPARAPGDVRHGDRLAGADLRRVLADPAGGAARLRTADPDRLHVADGEGPDLRPAHQLGV